MPSFYVIRCYSCGTFQTQQKKKSKTWKCVMCGEKQSLKKIYAESDSARSLKPIVQDYNMRRGEIEAKKLTQIEIPEKITPSSVKEIPDDVDWSTFLDENSSSEESDHSLNVEQDTKKRKGIHDLGKNINTSDNKKKQKVGMGENTSNLIKNTPAKVTTNKLEKDRTPPSHFVSNSNLKNSTLQNLVTSIKPKISEPKLNTANHREVQNEMSEWSEYLDTNQHVEESESSEEYITWYEDGP